MRKIEENYQRIADDRRLLDIRTKEASARPQDKIDIDKLKVAEQLDALDDK